MAREAGSALRLGVEDRRELEAAIAEYLVLGKFDCAEAFCREASVAWPETSDAVIGSLERRWSSTVRLQRQVLELEGELEEIRRPSAPPPTSEWCPSTSSTFALEGHSMAVACVASHATSGVVVSGSEDGTAKIWDLDRRSLAATVASHVDAVLCIAISGDALLTCSADKTAKLWDEILAVPIARATLAGHVDAVLTGCFLVPKRWCATASRDCDLRVWDDAGRSVFVNHHTDGWLKAIAARSDGDDRCVVAGGGSSHHAFVWRVDVRGRLDQVAQLAGHSHRLEALDWAPHDDFLLATGARDATVRLWSIDIDAKTADCIAVLEGHASWVKALCWLPGARRLVSAGDDRTIKVWDLDDGDQPRCLRTINDAHAAFVAALAVNRPTALLASAGADKLLKLWELR